MAFCTVYGTVYLIRYQASNTERRAALQCSGDRDDEAQFDQYTARRLADALKRRGVTEKVLQEAMKEIAENS